METFAQKFLRIYDRKLLSGEVTFAETGIRKSDFTRLCMDSTFVFPAEELEMICDRMHVTQEERAELLKFTEEVV